MKNPAELEKILTADESISEDYDADNVFFDDESIEELRKEFGSEIADKAKDLNLFYRSDNLQKHMVELPMNTMDVQSLIEIVLANPVAEDFNCKNPLDRTYQLHNKAIRELRKNRALKAVYYG